jgi:hypothetical protein
MFKMTMNRVYSRDYSYVAPHVSKEGNSYRVRWTEEGRRKSKSFPTKKAAMAFKKESVKN